MAAIPQRRRPTPEIDTTSQETVRHRSTEVTDEVLRMLIQRGATSIVIGSSRDEPSLESAAAIADAWQSAGGVVLTVIDWPEEAASWLRQARRFLTGGPDAWVVVIDSRTGWLELTHRLDSTGWDTARTLVVERSQALVTRMSWLA